MKLDVNELQFRPITSDDTMGVNPDFKGNGVGTALLERLFSNLDALGMPCQ